MTTTATPIAPPAAESKRLFDQACQYIPGGSSRVHYYFDPHPIFARSAAGCRLTDVDDIERIDFLNNMTSLIHGHCHPVVTAAIIDQLNRGTAYSEPAEPEIALARLMVERVPSVERIRFSNSGSEAVMLAIKLAREFTGRSKIAKFEGHYHGYYDYVQVSVRTAPAEWGPADEPATVASSGGLAESVAGEVVTFPFNDLDAVERLLEKHGTSLACFLVDPMAGMSGCPTPKPGFLAGLTDLCRKYGIVLLSDEVVSFRLAYGGAQERFGGKADLTVFGKIIGGGLPVGAVGGRADIMALLDPTGGMPRVISGGTFSANPLTMAAGLATLSLMTRDDYARLGALGDRLRSESNRIFEGANLRLRMGGDGSLFRINPVDHPVVDYRSSVTNAEPASVTTAIHRHLLDHGVIIARMGMGCLSTPMGDAEIDHFVGALEAAVGMVRSG